MIDLSAETIAAAKNNDLAAVTLVIEATEERVTQLARKYATTGGRTDMALLEDFAQVGRVAVWESLSRFNGATVAEFFSFMNTTVSGLLSIERKTQTRQGVSKDAAQRFENALSMTGGDAYEAERLVQDRAAMGSEFKTLSKDLAYAARISWQGSDAIDAPLNNGDDDAHRTVADNLVSEYGTPEEADFSPSKRSRPVSWVLVSRALEAHVTVPTDADTRKAVLKALAAVASGEIHLTDVEVLEDVVTVPRAERARKELTAAFNMLHGFLTQKAEGEAVPVEEPAVLAQRATKSAVRRTLSKMGPKAANILRGTFGIAPAPMNFGTDNEALLAEWVGVKRDALRGQRSKAKTAFKRIYLAGAAA
ncbi:hypothetical protein ACWGJW_02540 [Streptomyces nigrescens]